MTEPLVLAVDLGTQQCKAMVVEMSSGRVLARASASVDSRSSEPGMVEQDPRHWEDLLFGVAREAIDESKANDAILGIGLSGHMHTLVAVDEKTSPVHAAIAWNDTRAAQLGPRLSRIRSRWNPVIAAYTLPKLLWLSEHHPEAYQRMKSILFPKDYLRLRLTGALNTDPSDASSSLMWDFATSSWDVEVVETTGLEPTILPAVLPANECAGRLSKDAASRLALRPDLLVATGAGDVAAAVIGSAAAGDAAGLINAGTAAQVITVYASERQAVLEQRRAPKSQGYLFELGHDGGLFVMGALPSAGYSLAWWQRLAGGGRSFFELDALAANERLEQGAVLFLPYLQGTGTPAMVDGGLAGFLQLSGRETFERLTCAVLEGVAMGIRHAFEAVTAAYERPPEIVVTGGLGQSATFCQALSTSLNQVVKSRKIPDVSCLGAALTAATAVAGTTTLWPVEGAETVYEPEAGQREVAEARYQRYLRWADAATLVHHEAQQA